MQQFEGHIGAREGTVTLFTIVASMLFLQYPEYLVRVGGPAAWQVAILITLFGLLAVLPMVALGRRFPGQPLADISWQTAGPVLGPVLTLAVSAWLLAATVTSLRGFTETFITTILPQTPPSVIVMTGSIWIVFAAYRGPEAIARTAYLLQPLIVAGVITVLLFSLPRMDVTLLFPLWGFGIRQTLLGSLYFASLSAEAIALLAVGNVFRDARSLQHSSLLGILLFGLAATITVTVLVVTAGPPVARENPFPLYYLARLIYLGRFLQRTESLIVMFWIFAAGIRVAGLFLAGLASLAGALRLPEYRPLIFPTATIVAALSLLPKDYVAVIQLDRAWIRPLGFGVLAVPLLLWVLAAIRAKGAAGHAS
nr:MAG: hypothetical protein DIU55_10715 [Bacillota bacterium]